MNGHSIELQSDPNVILGQFHTSRTWDLGHVTADLSIKRKGMNEVFNLYVNGITRRMHCKSSVGNIYIASNSV